MWYLFQRLSLLPNKYFSTPSLLLLKYDFWVLYTSWEGVGNETQ